jgi:hypothetical protein
MDGAYYDGQVRSSVTDLVNDEGAVARLWKATATSLPAPALGPVADGPQQTCRAK